METSEILQMLSQSFSTDGTAVLTGTGTTTTISTANSGSIGILNPGTSSGTTYYVQNYPKYGYTDVINPVENDPQNAIDEIGRIIDKLMLNDDNENQNQAVKHLTYAKAYMEKILLDKINEKTHGHSESN